MTKDFYIFRHGQSTYNVVGRTQGQTNDSVLTDLGKEQAAAVGEKLKNKNIELIVTSPLKRAMQTADLANQSLKVPVQIDERFLEVNVGVVEGMYYMDIRSKYQDIFDKMHSLDGNNDTVCYPEGETKKQVRERVFLGLEYWASQPQYQSIAVSSHGIMLSQTLIALGQDITDIKNGAVLHIRKEDNQWKIIEWI